LQKSNHNETEVQAVLQKLKKKIINYQSKKNDSTLILMKFEDERTISRVSKYLENQNQLKKEQLQSVLNYVSDKRHAKTSLSCIILVKKRMSIVEFVPIALPKKTSKDNTSLASAIVTLLQSENLNSRHTKQD
jgi:ATP-dependent DNA helicase RecQ